ncbi:alkane 1-monooxygenase [Owenweeksia hongkongensis]|uniref:alkane 1-monooxygenase n=1 Tax=Owenweeksia hongkongensis TaxID=253245 RepID=UPI003A945542
MQIKALKYLLVYSLPLAVFFSFRQEGWSTFLPIAYSFGVIPVLELFIKPSSTNIDEAEQEFRKADFLYDFLLYLIVPIQVGFMIWYFFIIENVEVNTATFWGRTISLGLMCGVLGINVAHELGHRVKGYEKLMAKVLLMTSLYPHFFIEHNYGHHKNVATPEDPASARYNEVLYVFWIRSMIFAYISAWKIENKRVRRKEGSAFSLKNEMILFTLVEILLLVGITAFLGITAVLGFCVAAFTGILLLETVNYIEHYGLSRNKVSDNRYENATVIHSWNSNYLVGRLMLFELSRHSDHHANPVKKYQVLESYDESPQMPTGYPGMMILSAFPPLWFTVMNKRVRKYQSV